MARSPTGHSARFALSRVDSNKQLVLRSPRQIARSCDDYFLVSLQLAGYGRVLQDGRAALLGPGDFALYDSTRRYTLAFDDEFTQIVLKTPRALLTERLARAETCTALAIKGSAGMGRVAAELLRSVAREAQTLRPHEIERMAHAVIDVFATAFGQSPVQLPVSPAFASRSAAAAHQDVHRRSLARSGAFARAGRTGARYQHALSEQAVRERRDVGRAIHLGTAARSHRT